MNKRAVSLGRKILRWSLQIFIGLILLASALGKVLDMPGFVDVLQTYQVFPLSLLWPMAFLIIGIEVVLGVWVLSGIRLPMGALLAGGLNTVYAVWVTITLLRGLTLSNCGCFGVFFPQPLTWVTPIEDLVLVSFCVVLAYLSSTEEQSHRGFRTVFLN